VASFTATKLLWLKRHEPDVYAATRHVLLPGSYVNYWLTGKMAMEVRLLGLWIVFGSVDPGVRMAWDDGMSSLLLRVAAKRASLDCTRAHASGHCHKRQAGDASGTALFDTVKRCWDAAAIDAVDPGLKDKLPPLLGPEEVRWWCWCWCGLAAVQR